MGVCGDGRAWDGGQLVPTQTNRANYIHWLPDLLALSRPEGIQIEGRRGRGKGDGLKADLFFSTEPTTYTGCRTCWHFQGLKVVREAGGQSGGEGRAGFKFSVAFMHLLGTFKAGRWERGLAGGRAKGGGEGG